MAASGALGSEPSMPAALPNSQDAEPGSPSPTNSTQEEDCHYTGNGLALDGAWMDLEYIDHYRNGGHHPVHLKDRLGKDGRYRVIHKLGSGGFANVWLCRDLQHGSFTYVAVKIIMAHASTEDSGELRMSKLKSRIGLEKEPGAKFICLPLDEFWLEGPNGSHLCIVYPVAGPRVSHMARKADDSEGPNLRRIALQVTQGMAALHSRGICHGDLTTANILLRISGLDALSEEQLLEVLGTPEQVKVVSRSTGDLIVPETAPKYLVYPVDFDHLDARFVTDEALIIDFGESFETTDPPKNVGTPIRYSPPELILDKKASIGSDLWALAWVLFEIQTGEKLFNTFDDDLDGFLYLVVSLLGKLPEPWWTTWEGRKRFFEDEPDNQGRAVKTAEWTEEQKKLNVLFDPQSIEDMLEAGFPDFALDDEVVRIIRKEEIKAFAHLLYRLLKYNPADRLQAQEAQHHRWFSI